MKCRAWVAGAGRCGCQAGGGSGSAIGLGDTHVLKESRRRHVGFGMGKEQAEHSGTGLAGVPWHGGVSPGTVSLGRASRAASWGCLYVPPGTALGELLCSQRLRKPIKSSGSLTPRGAAAGTCTASA